MITSLLIMAQFGAFMPSPWVHKMEIGGDLVLRLK